MKQPLIFTDLDGTLLDHETYSFGPALPALNLIKEKRIYNPNKGIAPGKCRIPEFFDLRT